MRLVRRVVFEPFLCVLFVHDQDDGDNGDVDEMASPPHNSINSQLLGMPVQRVALFSEYSKATYFVTYMFA